jgi:hypothetical protein
VPRLRSGLKYASWYDASWHGVESDTDAARAQVSHCPSPAGARPTRLSCRPQQQPPCVTAALRSSLDCMASGGGGYGLRRDVQHPLQLTRLVATKCLHSAIHPTRRAI